MSEAPDAAAPAATGAPRALTCAAFEAEILSEFPRFRIRSKEGDALSQSIDWILRLITLGGQRHYLTHYHTVIGDTLYVPASWEALDDTARVILLRHERVHLRQRRRWGTLGMAALYLLPVFPVGLALGRARIEQEAYEETLRATHELLGPDALRDPELRARIVGRFTGPDYAWMWPFRGPVERWYDRTVEAIAETGPGRVDSARS